MADLLRALGVDPTPSVIKGISALLGPKLRNEVGRPPKMGCREPQVTRGGTGQPQAARDGMQGPQTRSSVCMAAGVHRPPRGR